MTGNNKKTLPIINKNTSYSSEKEIRSPYKEISPGCACGAASCENCPGISGMEMGSDWKTGYRNVFSYLRIVAVILAATWILKEVLSMI
ncbi:MAG: hypothetical protein QUS12_03365 [Methanosarcina sp.]|nr:hypothetical protein [Methanosarcina sp.]